MNEPHFIGGDININYYLIIISFSHIIYCNKFLFGFFRKDDAIVNKGRKNKNQTII